MSPISKPCPIRFRPKTLRRKKLFLGGILLDPDAIGRVADVLQPEAFYLGAHREIFRTAVMLHSQGKPTDLTAMTAWLADTGSLDKVGGSGRLVELVERVASTASIEQVARLVMDKFLRRQLIRSGNEVIQLGFDQSLPMEQVLDQAEQKIFAISQEKPSKGLTPTAEILTSTFNEIESRSLGTSVAGIPVNFYDLDAMTQGLQRSDLIIVCGAPSDGQNLDRAQPGQKRGAIAQPSGVHVQLGDEQRTAHLSAALDGGWHRSGPPAHRPAATGGMALAGPRHQHPGAITDVHR